MKQRPLIYSRVIGNHRLFSYPCHDSKGLRIDRYMLSEQTAARIGGHQTIDRCLCLGGVFGIFVSLVGLIFSNKNNFSLFCLYLISVLFRVPKEILHFRSS